MKETDIIKRAKELAFKMHNEPSKEQRYGSAPYSKHLEDVVTIAKRYLYYLEEEEREIVLAVCYLHDIVEDTSLLIC
jgi:(p)ppGpp synthase/HD superfamily hydrolase